MSEPASKSAAARVDTVLQQVTDRIVKALKEERVPWHRPWRVPRIPLRYIGLPFTGANSLILSLAADDRGYESPYWLTEAQGLRYRGKVKDGQHGTRVLRPIAFPIRRNPKTDRARVVPVMESYEVFNAEQFERLPPRFLPEPRGNRPVGRKERNLTVDAFFEKVGADVRHGGDEAFYMEGKDLIQMPRFDYFDDTRSYYGTLAHEAIHWTGHASRMRRPFGFDDEEYAAEELVAELGAVFLMGRLSLPYQPKQSASYMAGWAEKLGGWVNVLTGDKRALYNVAGHAQRAADYLAIAAESDKVNELANRPLTDRHWVVIYLDVVEVGSHPLAVAVGVTLRGRRRVLLGMSLAGANRGEQREAVTALLNDLVERGLSPDRRRLFVTDGSELLRKSVTKIFGRKAVIQACRRHREREVLEHVSVGAVPSHAKKLFQRAWERGAEDGPKLLARMADSLDRREQRKAAERLREDLGDLFVVDRYKLHPRLIRSLTTTNQIDCASSGLRRQICGVARWPHANIALLWAAASFLATERGWPRIGGYRHLQDLLDPDRGDVAVCPSPAQEADEDTEHEPEPRAAHSAEFCNPSEPVLVPVDENMSATDRVTKYVPNLPGMAVKNKKGQVVLRASMFIEAVAEWLTLVEQVHGPGRAVAFGKEVAKVVRAYENLRQAKHILNTQMSRAMFLPFAQQGPKLFRNQSAKLRQELRQELVEMLGQVETDEEQVIAAPAPPAADDTPGDGLEASNQHHSHPQPPHQPPKQEPTP